METKVTQITRTVLSNSMYAKMNVEDPCFLKSADAGRGMKSEVVSDQAPQAVPYDWLKEWMTHDL